MKYGIPPSLNLLHDTAFEKLHIFILIMNSNHCPMPECMSSLYLYFTLLSAYVGLSARMGVDGALGQAGVEWASELRSSSSLDGSVQVQEGRDLRVTLNTPEDIMDIISLR